MKTNITKIFSLTVAAAITASCASCSLIPGMGSSAKTEDIVDAADAFAKVLVSCDAGKIATYTNEEKDSSAVEDLEAILSSEDYTDEQMDIAEAVADTIEYEIDEESVKIDKDEASVDVTFTMVDYEAVLSDGKFTDVDEVIDAISDCDDTIETEITFEFALEDKVWLISNLGDKAYGKLYSFYGIEVDLMPDFEILTSFIDQDDYGTTIAMTVAFSEDISEYADGFDFDVYLDGELAYEDHDAPTIQGEYINCILWDSNGLVSGSYTFTLRYDGEEIVSESIVLDNTNSGSTVISGDPTDAEGDVYLCEMDFGDFLADYLVDSGYDVDLEGSLIIWLELTLYEDGTYTLIPDANTFEGDLEEYLINNMTDQNLIAFAGVSSMEELEEYADSNEMSIDSLRELLIDSMVSSTVEAIAEDTDQGTYTISGDSISFDSSLMNDFEGTIGDGNMISFVNDYFSPANDYVLEFYPEG